MLNDLPYNENDGYVGFWVREKPYNVVGTSYFNSGREYLSPNKITRSMKTTRCQNPVPKYFDVAPPPAERKKYSRQIVAPTSEIYMEGRRYYITSIKPETKKTGNASEDVVIPDIKLIDKTCVELSRFNDYKIYLHSLVCSQLSETTSDTDIGSYWSNILGILTEESDKSCPSICTEIGCKIAKSLIKIAALRIFADPEQSIMEIPVNSIDSYVPESRVGKFGMGFFSFLYWLIDHPLRVLYIYSWSKNKNGAICGYRATVRDSGTEGLILTIKVLETSVTQTGTLMYLDCKKDKFDTATQIKFYNQMQRLKNISSVKIYCTHIPIQAESTSDSHVFVSDKYRSSLINNTQKSKDSVYVCIGSTRIFVEDYAQGIPIEVLLGSLFVPSISTKTIKASTFQKKGEADALFKVKGPSSFEILVSGVSVVNIKIPSMYYGSATISMPSWTRLPVSRDDIILEDANTTKLFEDALLRLLELGAEDREVISIQMGLKLYQDYTVNPVNKQAVSSALAIFTEKYKSFLVTNELYTSLKLIDKKCILSNVMYAPEVESRLLEDFSKSLLTNVWYGKRVLLMDNTYPSVSTRGMSSLVFVDRKLTSSQKDWPITGSQANPSLSLNPINTNHGTQQNELYAKYVPAEIKQQGKTYEELYMAVVAVYDGLKVKFKFNYSQDLTLKGFCMLYTDILEIYGFYQWINVSYALLSVLTSYKGNQTYGGSQYTMILVSPLIRFRKKPSSNMKLMNYDVQSIIEIIKSVKERALTEFRATNILSPYFLESNFEKLDERHDLHVYAWFHVFLVQNTDTLVDYTICSMVFFRALSDLESKRELPTDYEKLIRVGSTIINKVKSLRYGPEDLKNMYIVANDATNINTMGLLIYMNFEKLINQTKFLIELSNKKYAEFPYKVLTEKDASVNLVTNTRISQLIGYLFSNKQKGGTLTEQDVRNIFTSAGEYKGLTKLQITEIAINEGTTKDFVSACLTELTQNSVDAIRESKKLDENRNININFGQTEDGTYSFMVEDFVGMPPSAFLYVSIPFLSTKTPSEIVTGEMGSGFFNVYRESSLVVIDTVYNGMNYISYDTPIIENGRVVDVSKKIYMYKTSNKNGTKIIVKSNKVSEEILSENIGSLRYITESVISQISFFNDIEISINGAKSNLKSKDKTHMFSIGYFDVYFIQNAKYPSYVFTKGIPFAPLSNFYVEYDRSVVMDIENAIVVNIRHGGYTPVQTRTRLNLPDDVAAQFKLLLAYIVFVKNLQLSYEDNKGHRDWMYPNLKSTAMADQLISYEHIAVRNEPVANFLNYINFDLLETKVFSGKNTLTYYTNSLIKSLGDENPRDDHVMSRLKKEVSKFNLSQYPEVRKLGEFMLIKWISNKNGSVIRSPAPKPKIGKNGKVIESKTGGEIEPDKPDKLMEPYVKIWVETFRDKAISCKIYGWDTSNSFKIEVGESEKFESALGYFDASKKLFYINTITWTQSDRKSIVSLVKNVKSTFDFQNLTNDKWARYFSFMYPAATIPHELEHARRRNSHEGGGHDITREPLWSGDVVRERTFDQSCNDVFSKVISEGFYDELLKRYKTAKLI